MALFKIFKGSTTDNLLKPIFDNGQENNNYKPLIDGYAYYDTSSKLFYIDTEYPEKNNDGTLKLNENMEVISHLERQPINANHANTSDESDLAALAIKSLKLPYITGTGISANLSTNTDGCAKWEAELPGITALESGLYFVYKIPVQGNTEKGTGFKLRYTDDLYHPVVSQNGINVGDSYTQGQDILLMYDATMKGTIYLNDIATEVTGCWVAINDYGSNKQHKTFTAKFYDACYDSDYEEGVTPRYTPQFSLAELNKAVQLNEQGLCSIQAEISNIDSFDFYTGYYRTLYFFFYLHVFYNVVPTPVGNDFTNFSGITYNYFAFIQPWSGNISDNNIYRGSISVPSVESISTIHDQLLANIAATYVNKNELSDYPTWDDLDLTLEDYLYNTDTAYKTASIPMGQVDNESTDTSFTASIDGITELRDGVCVWLRNGVVTSAANFTININNLGAKPCYSSLADQTRASTVFNSTYTLLLIYNSTRVEGGCWDIVYGIDSNTNTIGYQLRTNSTTMPVTDKFYRYRLLFTAADQSHYVPANTSSSTSATSAKTVNQKPIDPFGMIYYYGHTTAISANAKPTATYMWQQYNINLGYSFNRTGAALTLTSNAPVYLKCAPQSDGSAIIDADNPFVQILPTIEDNKIYIFLGIATSATNVELISYHPIYYYCNNQIRLWTGTQGKAFSTIKIDTTSINADSETDIFQIITGNNITLTPDVVNKKVTINATNTTYRAATSAPPNIASQGDYGQSQAYAREDHTHGISVGEGDSNGQVKIAGQNASVKGLGAAAYKNITDNTTATLVSLNDTNLITARTLYNAGYLPTSGGTMSGAIISNVTPTDDKHLTNKAYVDNLVNSSFAANDAMIFKGTLNGGNSETNTTYTPAADRGHTYKIADPGFINGEKVETGDTLICIVDSTVEATSSNVNSVKNNWTIVQANLDGVVIGPASAINSHVAVFDTNSGKLIRDGGYTIAAHVPANAQFTDTTYSAGTGLDLSGTTFNHSNSVTAQETEAVYPIKIDAQGHIKSYGTAQTILSLGNTDSTAFPGNQGLVAYTHATNKGSAFNSGLYKITTNDQGHVINAVAVTKTDITALGIPAENTNTDTKVNVRTRGVEKSYILADFTAPGTTAAAHEAVADTDIYMDTYSGRLAATEYKVGEAVVLQYNSTTSALEFNFI